jgi:hypothetical protein
LLHFHHNTLSVTGSAFTDSRGVAATDTIASVTQALAIDLN